MKPERIKFNRLTRSLILGILPLALMSACTETGEQSQALNSSSRNLVAGDLTASPSSLTFNLDPSDAPATQTVTVSNSGSSAATIRVTPGITGVTVSAMSTTAASSPVLPVVDPNADFVPGEIIVQYNSVPLNVASTSSVSPTVEMTEIMDLTPRRRNRAIQRNATSSSSARLVLAKLNTGTKEAVLDAIEILSQDPNVAFAQPNYRYTTDATPNDPAFSDQYYLNNIGQTGGTADADVDAAEGWDINVTTGSTVIAVIDSGADYRHPDLLENIWVNPGEIPNNGIDDDANGYVDDVHGWDFADNDNDPMDADYHGTHVAGTIAARGDNGIGIAGTAWRSRLMILKMFRTEDGGGSSSAAISAINYAADMGIKIINNSWGGDTSDPALEQTIANTDALFVFAAGNKLRDVDVQPHYPCSYSLANILCVASTDANDILDVSSSGTSGSNYGVLSVDLAAPGADVLSTMPVEENFWMIYRGIETMYDTISGTSMATPIVSGIAGLVNDANPTLSVATLKSVLMSSVDQLDSLDGLCVTEGRINMRRALENTPREWLDVSPSLVNIGPGATVDFDITVDPETMKSGVTTFNVGFAEYGTVLETVPVTVNVGTCKQISANAVNFGTIWAGVDNTVFLPVENTCNSAVTISSIQFPSLDLSLMGSLPITVPAFETVNIPIDFNPHTTGAFASTATLLTDATNAPQLTVPITATSSVPPKLYVYPNAVNDTADLETNFFNSQMLTVYNSGAAPLDVDISTWTNTDIDDIEWLTVYPSSFTIPAHSSSTVSVDTTSLYFNVPMFKGALYEGEVRFSTNDPTIDGYFTLPVTLDVSGTPQIEATPSTLTFSAQTVPSAVTFTPIALQRSNVRELNSLNTADMDGDGDMDIVTGNQSIYMDTQQLLWFENIQSDRFLRHEIDVTTYPMRIMILEVEPVDFDGDGDMDVIARVHVDESWKREIRFYENTGDRFVKHVLHSEDSEIYDMVVADFDGDSDADIVFSDYTGRIRWYENNQPNSELHTITTNVIRPVKLQPIDVNGDGYMDIVCADKTDNQTVWFENNGDETFTKNIVLILDEPNLVAAADFDADGDIDFLTAGSSDDLHVLQNNGNGQYTDTVIFESDNLQDISIADINLDNLPDIVIRHSDKPESTYIPRTSWIKNLGGMTFDASTIIQEGISARMSLADMNNDGDLDIVLGTANDGFFLFNSDAMTNVEVVALANTGNAPLTVTSLNVDNARFTPLAPLPLMIPSDATAYLPVAYAFVPNGDETGVMIINSDAAASPQAFVTLNGPSDTFRIEAEDYDRYYDSTTGNSGGGCDTGDDVDKEVTGDSVGGGCNVGWTTAGEWLEYDISIPQSQDYDITARVASEYTGTSCRIEIDGVDVSGSLDAYTGAWQSYVNRTAPDVYLTAGNHVVRVYFETDYVNINYIAFTFASQYSYCGDGVCDAGEHCSFCGIDCGACIPEACTCPSGCDAVVNQTAPFEKDGIDDTCYFFSGSAGDYINSWNTTLIDINGVNITNVWIGAPDYPTIIDGGHYLYVKSDYGWSHLEVK